MSLLEAAKLIDDLQEIVWGSYEKVADAIEALEQILREYRRNEFVTRDDMARAIRETLEELQ